MIIRLAQEYHELGKSVNTHIVRLPAATAIATIRAAKIAGAPLTVDTCFHYLNFNSEAIEVSATSIVLLLVKLRTIKSSGKRYWMVPLITL